jgi:ATP-binding cassette subfamily B multidrug efflux pump
MPETSSAKSRSVSGNSEKSKSSVSFRLILRTLTGEIREYKKPSILAPIFTAGEVLMEVLLPYVMADIIDEGIEAGNMHAILVYGGVMLVLAFLSLFCGMMAGRCAAEASCGLAANVRDDMYQKIQTYSFSNIDKYSTAGLITRLTTDVTNMQNAYQMIIRIAIRPPLMLIMSLIMAILISPSLSVIYFVAVVFLSVVLAFLMIRASNIFNKVFTKYDDLNESVKENVSGIRVVKAYVREDYENQKFTKAAKTLQKLFTKAEGILAFNSPIMYLVIYASIIALSWFGARQVVGGSLSTGSLTSLLSYITNIMVSLMLFSMVIVMISMSFSGCRRITEVLNETPDLKNPDNPVTEVADGSIDFDHVSFSYKSGTGNKVLRDINLHIKSGEMIGITGPTGCGKSTLVSLISRLYDATEGTVKVGGLDVKKYDLKSLRDQVSVVLQKNTLFSGTILDNLRWGDESATREECIEACKEASADEFICLLPDGYDAKISQGGTNVSGGQKQRLCIARALLKKPKILILDDSTSAVDTATERKIREAFRTKIPGTTKLIISQRLSSIEEADRVIVLDNGRICGFDTPDNLLKTNKVYQEIYETQKAGSGDFDMAPGAAGA